jgi:hypothetical protein
MVHEKAKYFCDEVKITERVHILWGLAASFKELAIARKNIGQ